MVRCQKGAAAFFFKLFRQPCIIIIRQRHKPPPRLPDAPVAGRGRTGIGGISFSNTEDARIPDAGYRLLGGIG